MDDYSGGAGGMRGGQGTFTGTQYDQGDNSYGYSTTGTRNNQMAGFGGMQQQQPGQRAGFGQDVSFGSTGTF